MSAALSRWTLLFVAVFLLVTEVHAQGVPAAKRTIAVSAYGGYAYVSPDYGGYDNTGFFFGADVGRSFHHIEAAIDLRYIYSTGEGVGEKSVLGGPKVEIKLGHAHPYIDLQLGYGLFDFTHPTSSYVTDNSIVYAYGGGVDYELFRGFGIKGDLQLQHWQLGNANNPLEPVVICVGVTYRVPIHSTRGPR